MSDIYILANFYSLFRVVKLFTLLEIMLLLLDNILSVLIFTCYRIQFKTAYNGIKKGLLW